MSLEKLLATNIFSRVPSGVQREYVPFNEALTAQAFAEAINSGKMSVEDAWKYFWSYDEDAEFWGLPQDAEWRALLPAWDFILLSMGPQLDNTPAFELVHTLSDAYLRCDAHRRDDFPQYEYNPFLDDALIGCCAVGRPLPREKFTCLSATLEHTILPIQQFIDMHSVDRERYKSIRKNALWFDIVLLYHLCGKSDRTLCDACLPFPDRIASPTEPPRHIIDMMNLDSTSELLRSYFAECRAGELDFRKRIPRHLSVSSLKSYREAYKTPTDPRTFNESIYISEMVRRLPDFRSYHQSLKPYGYNPAVKKLVVLDVA